MTDNFDDLPSVSLIACWLEWAWTLFQQCASYLPVRQYLRQVIVPARSLEPGRKGVAAFARFQKKANRVTSRPAFGHVTHEVDEFVLWSDSLVIAEPRKELL